MYGLRKVEYIARELNRPLASIKRMAASLFPKAERKGAWTESECQRLKRFLGICEVDVIARIFGRSPADVAAHIKALDEGQEAREWTPAELAQLKRTYGTREDRDIARILQRPEVTVRAMASELHLAKDKAFVRKLAGKNSTTRMPRWTPEEVAQLQSMYAEYSNLDIAQVLNRSVKSVVSKANLLGLKKDPKRLVEMGRQNVSGRYKSSGEEEATEAGSDPADEIDRGIDEVESGD
jgi:hypothetical protein